MMVKLNGIIERKILAKMEFCNSSEINSITVTPMIKDVHIHTFIYRCMFTHGSAQALVLTPFASWKINHLRLYNIMMLE